MSYNRVILIGNLTRDVELKATQGGQSVASFGLAINRRWKDASGAEKDEVTFVDCTAWGKTGEAIARFFGKGRPIFVEGRLKFDQWEDKQDGSKRSKLSVVVESFQFCDSKSDASASVPPAKPTTARPGVGPKAPAGMDLPESDDIPW